MGEPSLESSTSLYNSKYKCDLFCKIPLTLTQNFAAQNGQLKPMVKQAWQSKFSRLRSAAILPEHIDLCKPYL
jgi:hypothetical protein